MAESIFDQPRFQDPTAAREYLESIRWPNGPVCPHCGSEGAHYALNGDAQRDGLYKCKDCREQFTVTVGTVFERSKVPLHKWIMLTELMCASKKGISSKQVERMLGVTYKTAWFMTHRIREAMREGGNRLLGGSGNPVEVDETFIGRDHPKEKGHRGTHHMRKVLSLVDRKTGRSRSIVIDDLKAKTIVPILEKNIAKNSIILTDEGTYYSNLNMTFAQHYSVNHSKGEYVNLKYKGIHTNTIEGFFSIFKRGMKGVYQHCGHNHLHRYLSEFDFRYSHREKLGFSDTDRTIEALKGIEGKRLFYHQPH